MFIFVALAFWTFNFYLERKAKFEAKEYDLEVITAADFTANFKISETNWEHYKIYLREKELRDGIEREHQHINLDNFSNYL